MALRMAYTCVYVTHKWHTTTLHTGEAQTQGHTSTHTHTGARQMRNNGGWRDTTEGYVDQRGRCSQDDQVLA